MSESHETELTDLEMALAALQPAPTALNRDSLMFEAGRASAPAERARWGWPLATLVATGMAACLALFIVLRGSPAEQIRYVIVSAPEVKKPAPERESPIADPPIFYTAPLPIARDAPEHSAWRLQEIALRYGVDALPVAARGPSEELPMPKPNNDDPLVTPRPAFVPTWSSFLFGGR